MEIDIANIISAAGTLLAAYFAYKMCIRDRYVYVRILQQPISLPDKRTMVMRSETSFDYEWSTLRKAYDQKALNLEIVQTDGYYNAFPHNTQEVTYNYLGTQTMPKK